MDRAADRRARAAEAAVAAEIHKLQIVAAKRLRAAGLPCSAVDAEYFLAKNLYLFERTALDRAIRARAAIAKAKRSAPARRASGG